MRLPGGGRRRVHLEPRPPLQAGLDLVQVEGATWVSETTAAVRALPQSRGGLAHRGQQPPANGDLVGAGSGDCTLVISRPPPP